MISQSTGSPPGLWEDKGLNLVSQSKSSPRFATLTVVVTAIDPEATTSASASSMFHCQVWARTELNNAFPSSIAFFARCSALLSDFIRKCSKAPYFQHLALLTVRDRTLVSSIPFGEKVCRPVLAALSYSRDLFLDRIPMVVHSLCRNMVCSIAPTSWHMLRAYLEWSIITFVPIVALMYQGEKWRKYLGEPDDWLQTDCWGRCSM